MAENVRVYLRIRPKNQADSTNCLMVDPQNPEQAVTLFNGPKAEIYTYDSVGGPETSQEAIFETVARPVTDYCLQGYNGTIFAYGQTGSGKTFTMQGPMTENNLIDYNQRGLIPRTFEYLFECIRAEEEASAASPEAREFLCKCSYVEIYNETIFDLLDASGGTCSLREDIKRGVYIEGAREEIISSPSEAYEVYERGSLNRHVAETSMNRESSRSHSVFTLFIQSKMRVGEIVDVRESRFNLVDLAGSERQQMTGTTGQRLKEAGNINKSLLALGNVINGLVDISHGRPRHVQYRDSKLTFLLRDSLGGNAKTVIIANVSPSPLYFNETLSTLKFAQRAKMIKNKAVVNKDIQGNVLQLQAEIQRLQHELYLSRHYSANNSIMIDSSKKPKIDGFTNININNYNYNNNNTDELDAAEAYLMLTLALERQAEASDEIESFRNKLHLLEELVKRKESQNQSLRMILKFRENSLKTPPQEASEVVQDLRDEIQELRKIIEHHPEVTRFAYENLQLREKLYKYESNQKRLDEFEAILQKHKQYEQLLTNRLLILEKRNEKEVEEDNSGLDSSEMVVNDNVPMTSITSESNDKDVNSDNTKGDNKFDISGYADRISVLEKECERLRVELLESSTTATNYRQDIENLWEANSKIEASLKEERGNNECLKEQLEKTGEELEKIRMEYEKVNNDYSRVKRELDKTNSEYSRLQVELDNASSEYDRVKQEYSSIKSEYTLIQQQYTSVKQQCNNLKELEGVLEAERESLSRLMHEKDELKGRFEASQRQLEREKDQSRSVLQDYEVAKGEFNRRIQELNEEIEKQREEVETAAQKVKSAQAERTLLQQELEVTRQILAEYKTNSNKTNANTQDAIKAAEEAGRRISQLESESSALKEQVQILSSQAQAATSLADRNKILQAENGQLHGKIGKLEFLMRSAQSDNDELMAQVTQLQKHLETSLSQKSTNNNTTNNNISNISSSSKSDNSNDPNMISSSAQAQLDAANHTISTLKRQLTTLEGELQELRGENDRLVQHQNLKQKLQYHLKMKQENNELQEELNRCRDELNAVRIKQTNLAAFLNEIKEVSATQKGAEKVVQMIKNMNI